MLSATCDEFITTRSWHRAVVGGRDMILRHTSALEFLEYFSGYMRETNIEVYAKHGGEYENIDFRIVGTFDGIEHVRIGDVLCTSVNQTFNDMLADYDTVDEQALVEGLSRYYHTHGGSFDGLTIKPENLERFNTVRDWAVEYYDED